MRILRICIGLLAIRIYCKVLHDVERVEDLPLFGYDLKNPMLSVKLDLVEKRVLLIEDEEFAQNTPIPGSIAFQQYMGGSARKLKQMEAKSIKSESQKAGSAAAGVIFSSSGSTSNLGSFFAPIEFEQIFASDDQQVIEFEQIFGTDDRIQVANTNEFPFRTIGKLDSTCNGKPSGCTGTLIGPRTVMTAAHCVRRPNYNCTEFTFAPAQQKYYQPFGSIKVVDILLSPQWINDMTTSDNDYALMTLEQDIGLQVGWMGFGYSCSDLFQDIYTAGYPIDLDPDSDTMFNASCPQTELNACPCIKYPAGSCQVAGNTFEHMCDTWQGQSGSPLFVYMNGDSSPQIRGIHSSADKNANKAVIINSKIYKFYRNYMKKT